MLNIGKVLLNKWAPSILNQRLLIPARLFHMHVLSCKIIGYSSHHVLYLKFCSSGGGCPEAINLSQMTQTYQYLHQCSWTILFCHDGRLSQVYQRYCKFDIYLVHINMKNIRCFSALSLDFCFNDIDIYHS